MCVRLFLLTFVVLVLALSGTVQADLLQNGGFETNAGTGSSADYWTNTEEAGIESWAAHTNSWGMAFVTWRGDGTGDFYQDVSVVENTLCTYKIWASRDAGTLTGAYYMKIMWYNGDTYISEDSQLLDITDTWVQKTLTATSPTDANVARVMISGVGIDRVGKFDDAEFTTAPPATPTNMIATGYDSRIDLRWQPVSYSNLLTYNIYRSASAGGTFTKLNSSPHTVSVYSNFFGTNNQTYYYYVTAVANSQESNPSTTVSAASYAMTDNQLLTSVQEATFRYFWDFAHPVSGLTREGYNFGHSTETCTTGGSGMGLMAICVGAERGFVTRTEAAARILKILTFLDEETTRYHGVWSHWIDGTTGETITFSKTYNDQGVLIAEDDGGDLVETSFMMQGMLAVRQYFDSSDSVETEIRTRVTSMWEDVDWYWYLRRSDSGYENNNRLYWHWSPNWGWAMNLPIVGYNECMITYLLAIASPTYPAPASCYYDGWASGWYENNNSYYGYWQWVGAENDPLFLVHYSFLGFDPRGKSDGYCNYFYNSRNTTLINHAYCVDNPKGFAGYGDLVWGLTASFNPWGYGFQAPGDADNGTIAPTAAIGSMPYTPDESIATLKHFYHTYGENLWGPFGFVDSFNLNEDPDWFAPGNVAIDQGPIVVMIENYRTRLCWNAFMDNPEIQPALDAIGWTTLDPENFVLASYETDETGLTFTSPDAGVTTLQSVQGGINGAPAATDGNNVLKLTWTGETDRKVEVKHQWSNLTFDLAGYDELRMDVYIADNSAMPGTIGVWDDVFGWISASNIPLNTNQWFTISIDVSNTDHVCLDHISAYVFQNLAGDSGTIYMDNFRLIGPHVINFSVPYSERQQSNYSGAACLKMALDYQAANSYTQTSLHNYGVANNSTANQGSSYIDPQGMYLAMNNYELNSTYNYAALSSTTLNDAYHTICYWIAYCVPNADPENLPAMIPTSGNYENWVIVNGFSASDNPSTSSSYTVNGFWITDPSASGIGENIYKTASELGNDYVAISTGDSWNGKFVSVCEPPEQQAKVAIAKLAKYKDKLSSKQDVIAAAIKGLKDNVLDIDGELEVAYIGSQPGKPILVRDKGGNYFIVPFVKNDGCSVAVIVDAKDGTFRQASYCDTPDVKYLKRFDKSIVKAKRMKGKSLQSRRNAFLPSFDSTKILND